MYRCLVKFRTISSREYCKRVSSYEKVHDSKFECKRVSLMRVSSCE